MNVFADIRDMLISFVLLFAIICAIVAVEDPRGFGVWLQKIDQGRYEYIDCDCTEPLE
jgi:hypothetical protein